MAQPADLGPEVDPNSIIPGDGKQYYWFFIPRDGYKKVTIVRRDDANPVNLLGPYFWLTVNYVDEPQPPYLSRLGINPAYFNNPPQHRYHRFYEARDSAKIQAQTNVMRNLGRYGKVPMNIAMHKLPGYLGLGGGRRRTAKRRRISRIKCISRKSATNRHRR